MLFFARVFRGERPLGECGALRRGAGRFVSRRTSQRANLLGCGRRRRVGWLLARQWRDRRLWSAAAICFVVCGVVSAVQALPAIEYGRQALRWSGTPEPQHWNDRIPYSVHAEYSLKTRSIPGMLVPGLAVHANSFIGIVALGLALAAVRLRWKSPDVRLCAFVAGFALLLALGSDTPVHWLAYRFIPFVEKARYPAMAVVLAQVGNRGAGRPGT